jgi:antitoxin CptB
VAAVLRGVKPGRGVIKKRFSMHHDLQTRRRRAAYRASHRGTKEMDIVLGRYAAARLDAMSEAELGTFERFLALPDPVLTQWFTQGAVADEGGEFASLLAALRTHHGLAPPATDEHLETQ